MIVEHPKESTMCNKENIVAVPGDKSVATLQSYVPYQEQHSLLKGDIPETMFWKLEEGNSIIRQLFRGLDTKPAVTYVGGHQFSNLTNCNINVTITNPSAAATFLKNVQGSGSETNQ